METAIKIGLALQAEYLYAVLHILVLENNYSIVKNKLKLMRYEDFPF